MISSRTCWVVACAAGFLLAACDDGPPPDAPATAPTAATPVKPAVSPLPPEMVAAVSSSKNSTTVSVHFSLNGIPTVGKPLPVDIAIVPHGVLSAVTAHFEARDGLALATGSSLDRVTDPAADKVIRHQLILLPGKEGVFMVTAMIDTETGEGSTSRIFSIPVIVGAPAATPAPSPPPPAPATPASG